MKSFADPLAGVTRVEFITKRIREEEERFLRGVAEQMGIDEVPADQRSRVLSEAFDENDRAESTEHFGKEYDSLKKLALELL